MADNRFSKSSTRPYRLVLVGFMGAGKTSVGRELGKFLEWDFIDLDDEIERVEGRTVRELFAGGGEAYFRSAELRELERVLREIQKETVVSVGGGTFAQAGCADIVGTAGAISVLLDAPVEELLRRVTMGANTRPLAADREKFAKLYAERQQAYAAADVKFDTTGKSIPRVAREIAEWVRQEVIRPDGKDEGGPS